MSNEHHVDTDACAAATSAAQAPEVLMREAEPSVITNVDVEVLAMSPLVRAFMERELDACRDELTGCVFPSILAKRAADGFDLYHRDEVTFARTLLRIAAAVIDHDRASRRLRER